MALPLDKLLALKTFYFGMLALEHEDSRALAIRMLNTAIDQLQSASDEQGKTRLAFYHLARAELHRDEHDPLPDRLAAQRICESIGSLLYEHAMLLVDSTTVRSRGQLRERFASAYAPIASSDPDELRREHSRQWWLEHAMGALGESTKELTKSQRHFLERVTLRQLLNKHGIKTDSMQPGPE